MRRLLIALMLSACGGMEPMGPDIDAAIPTPDAAPDAMVPLQCYNGIDDDWV